MWITLAIIFRLHFLPRHLNIFTRYAILKLQFAHKSEINNNGLVPKQKTI